MLPSFLQRTSMIWSVVIDILKLGSERRFPTQARSPGRFSPVVAAWRSVVPEEKRIPE